MEMTRIDTEIDEAIAVLTEDMDIHQKWFNFFKINPSCETAIAYKAVGSLAHHKKWVGRYEKIINLLQELRDER